MPMINCFPDTKIYIFCPAGYATGGPEALHQLAYHLNNLGFNAFMYYYLIPESIGLVHESYEAYKIPYVSQVENKPEHIIIVPETYLLPLFKKEFSLVRKAIWWLSIGFYYKTQKIDNNTVQPKRFLDLRDLLRGKKKTSFNKLKKIGVLNIAHSHYSLVHLKENGLEPIGQISDYMNAAFFESAKVAGEKKDIIIYNPRKNDDFLQEIISLTPDLNWVALTGMTQQQVADWMSQAKLYVDFGYHPGKERMPREAGIMRCCMIIGKTGSAAYQQDMPIAEKYRFDKNQNNIPLIIERIKDCLINYDKAINDFKPYRQAIYHEKEKFIDDIQTVFVKET
jgi:hypothetical protein